MDNVNYERKTKAKIETNIKWDLDGLTLEDAVEYLRDLQTKYSSAAIIEITDDDSSYCSILVKDFRPETDFEMTNRIAREERNETLRQKAELAELSRLQKKYGSANGETS